MLSIAGLSALVYGIIEAPDNGWMSTQTLATFGAAVVILGAFVAWELKSKDPMLDLGYFRNPRFTAATTAITLVFFAMFGSYFLFTQYLQFVHGYSPLSAGVRILPWALAYLVSATQSAKLVEKFGQRLVVSSGLTIAGLGIALLAITSTVTSSYWWFALAVVVQALGMGITTAPSTGAIMRSLPLHKAGVGSAVNDTTRELGGALGVAVLGSLVASQFRSSFHDAVSGLPAKATHSLADALQSAAATGGTKGASIAARGAVVVRRRVQLHPVGRRHRRGDRIRHRRLVAAPDRDREGRRHGRSRGGRGAPRHRRGRPVIDHAVVLDGPAVEELDLVEILQALGDPVRLQVVRLLANADGPIACHEMGLPVAKSTGSHHLKVLREAGVVTAKVDGTRKYHTLRRDDLEARFPGLLDSVLHAGPA